MNHGSISPDVARGLRILRDRIERANIPSSCLDEAINIATWNIREFGRRPRLTASIHYIAEILGQFDLIAVTEVRSDLEDLRRVLEILGPYWRVVFSDYITDPGGNRERIAYVYDKRAVAFTGLAAEADGPRKKNRRTKEYELLVDWWRKPYLASFRAGNFDFVVVTAHIRWGGGEEDRITPLELLAEWVYKRRRDADVFDKDIIVMGDFNIPSRRSRTYEAISSRGLRTPAALTGTHGTNLALTKHYDQILHSPSIGHVFTDRGGVLDFYTGGFGPLYPGVRKTKTEFTYEMSDHLPLWIQLDVDRSDVDLDQIIRAG